MILVLGGTTEGRLAVQALEEAGSLYYYSTKGDEQEVTMSHGLRISGGMDEEEMSRFCEESGIALLVDAAHPFAEILHQTVERVSRRLNLPVVRFERIYPDINDEGLCWCDDYPDAIAKISESGVGKLLALTGVGTIARLRALWSSGLECHFRILDRESSRSIVRREGFPMDKISYYNGDADDRQLMERLSPDAILVKESGASGGFPRKVKVARELGIAIYVIRRPATPSSFIKVNGPHGLRRMVERLLPGFYHLRSGLTTGSCATAASLAATYSLFGNRPVDVGITLPSGESLPVNVRYVDDVAGEAFVIKDAGDDPDITDGTEIHSVVEYHADGSDGYDIDIDGGIGVGRVTLPGLGLPVGSAAINDTPRRMIMENITRLLSLLDAPKGRYSVTISIPDGERLAVKTFNPRLGVVGGISIIGTSGIVKPFSSDAFVRSIRKSMEVACATGSEMVVINSGAKSERFLHAFYPELPMQVFVHYGNFIGDTLKIAAEAHVRKLVMGVMIGKAVKLAEGHLDTHSKQTVMNLDFIRNMLLEAGCSQGSADAISSITLAREIWDILPPDELKLFIGRLVSLCHKVCDPLFNDGELTILIISERGEVYPSCLNNLN